MTFDKWLKSNRWCDEEQGRFIWEAATKATRTWQPISTAPKDESWVLGLADGQMYVMRWWPQIGWHYAWDSREGPVAVDTPTHWMTLPDEPRNERE